MFFLLLDIGLLTEGTRKQTTVLPPLLFPTPPHYALSVGSLLFTNTPHTSVFAQEQVDGHCSSIAYSLLANLVVDGRSGGWWS